MSSLHISSFPSELTINIFSFLSPSNVCVCARVCRLWRELAKEGQIWRGFATQLTPITDKKELTGAENLKDRVLGVILSAQLQIREADEKPPLQKWQLDGFDCVIQFLRAESIVMFRTASPLPKVMRAKSEAVEREDERERALIHVTPIRLALSRIGECVPVKA
ncbi:MAG: hypothetical protein K1000chlam4_00676 [Chlamydiae bacterium]|nr:hypothetical protein [Chlamydiota bacterium]